MITATAPQQRQAPPPRITWEQREAVAWWFHNQDCRCRYGNTPGAEPHRKPRDQDTIAASYAIEAVLSAGIFGGAPDPAVAVPTQPSGPPPMLFQQPPA